MRAGSFGQCFKYPVGSNSYSVDIHLERISFWIGDYAFCSTTDACEAVISCLSTAAGGAWSNRDCFPTYSDLVYPSGAVEIALQSAFVGGGAAGGGSDGEVCLRGLPGLHDQCEARAGFTGGARGDSSSTSGLLGFVSGHFEGVGGSDACI